MSLIIAHIKINTYHFIIIMIYQGNGNNSTSDFDRNTHGDSLGGFAKSSFLGTLSVPLDLKVRKTKNKIKNIK